MSRIGKQPVQIPDKVDLEIGQRKIKVTGPKGELVKDFPRGIVVEKKAGEVLVKRKNETKRLKSLHGTVRAHIQNMVKGVSKGWSKELELVGTGYRAKLEGDTLVLTVGFSHPVKIETPEGINFSVQKTSITIEGADKDLVGQTAAKIRSVRPPEPYKGKGIKYKDEVVRRKPGKAAKATGAGVI